MMVKQAGLMAALVVGYVLLLYVVFRYIVAPWSYVVAAMIVLKAVFFLTAIARAAKIGAGRR